VICRPPKGIAVGDHHPVARCPKRMGSSKAAALKNPECGLPELLLAAQAKEHGPAADR
jgi:hypothetical protein